jgi:hypothetical protein
MHKLQKLNRRNRNKNEKPKQNRIDKEIEGWGIYIGTGKGGKL